MSALVAVAVFYVDVIVQTSDEDTETTVVVGGIVRLECYVDNLQGDEDFVFIGWVHEGDTVVADGEHFSIEEDMDMFSSELEIDNVVLEDAGDYVCRVRLITPEGIVDLEGDNSVHIDVQGELGW